jgi:hypothetical protein
VGDVSHILKCNQSLLLNGLDTCVANNLLLSDRMMHENKQIIPAYLVLVIALKEIRKHSILTKVI